GRSADDVPPSLVIEHCQNSLAAFKLPRYVAYRHKPLPRTASGKVTKQPLRDEQSDLRDGSWDRIENRWRPENSFDKTTGDRDPAEAPTTCRPPWSSNTARTVWRHSSCLAMWLIGTNHCRAQLAGRLRNSLCVTNRAI